MNGNGKPNPIKLRELAAWYREFAEKTANPTIWEARLRMAEDLEAEAQRHEGEDPNREDMRPEHS